MLHKDHEEDLGEIEKIRNRLAGITSKIKERSQSRQPPLPHGNRDGYVSRESGEMSLGEIHGKLRAIRNYLNERVDYTDSDITSDYDIDPDVDAPENASTGMQLEEPPVDIGLTPDTETYSSIVVREIKPELPPESFGRLGAGLDVGTSRIVAAREVDGKPVPVKSERNVFLSLQTDGLTRNLLNKYEIKYVSVEDKMYVFGDPALNLANILKKEPQRPMKLGILNPKEEESSTVMRMLVENVLGPPRVKDEPCCFSIPARPIDRNDDTIHHRNVIESILKSLGYSPFHDEGYAVILSELERCDFTGIGVSCGGGLVNICAAFKSMPVISFSISRGGDWIDERVSSVLGMNATKICAAKEKGIKLDHPVGREEEAIAVYYRHFIRYICENMAMIFNADPSAPKFEEPVDVIFTGGSTMVGGFLDVARHELASFDFGFPLGAIELAEEPLASVSRGCLLNAIISRE